MAVMLDTSALIGLHEGSSEVTASLANILRQHDDGTPPKTHQVVLAELWTGVLAVGDSDDPQNRRRPVLDTARSLDVETIEAVDARVFAEITGVTNRSMSHNDRWICAAALRTRSTLITQDADMAEQFGQYLTWRSARAAAPVHLQVIYVPRN